MYENMTFLSLSTVLFLAVRGLCEGLSIDILMDRLDDVESGIENQNKIRRREMAVVYEKISRMDALEEKVTALTDSFGTQTLHVARSKVDKDIDEKVEKQIDIRGFVNVILNAFRREKGRNLKLREDFERLKTKLTETLDNHNVDQSSAIKNLMETFIHKINELNETVYDIKFKVNNISTQIEKYAGLYGRVEQVIDNITVIQDQFVEILTLQKEFDVLSEKTEVLSNNLFKPKSCKMRKNLGHKSGVFELWSVKQKSMFPVYCDQETDGGGWIVFQRRKDGSVDFDRNWNDYKEGFGDPNGEFWLGNDHLNHLTSDGTHELRVDIEDFDGNKAYAKYSYFKVLNEKNNYRLKVREYSGNAGDALIYHNRKIFSTKDRWHFNKFCSNYNAGWWFGHCALANLNGEYFQRFPPKLFLGISWQPWIGYNATLKFTEMKFRQLILTHKSN